LFARSSTHADCRAIAQNDNVGLRRTVHNGTGLQDVLEFLGTFCHGQLVRLLINGEHEIFTVVLKRELTVAKRFLLSGPTPAVLPHNDGLRVTHIRVDATCKGIDLAPIKRRDVRVGKDATHFDRVEDTLYDEGYYVRLLVHRILRFDLGCNSLGERRDVGNRHHARTGKRQKALRLREGFGCEEHVAT
jgi:hypothetical protein